MTSRKKAKSTNTWAGLLLTGLYAGFVAASLNILIYLTIIWIGGYDSEMVVFLSILVASLLPNLLAAVAYYSLLRITTKARSLFTIGVGIFLLVSILPHVGVGPPPSPALSLLPENFDFKHLAYMDD